MSHIPYYGEDDLIDFRGRVYPAPELDAEDVLNQEDTVSLEELEDPAYDQMSRAGIDEQTATDTFLNMNGETRYVTDLYPR